MLKLRALEQFLEKGKISDHNGCLLEFCWISYKINWIDISTSSLLCEVFPSVLMRLNNVRLAIARWQDLVKYYCPTELQFGHANSWEMDLYLEQI